MAGGYLVDTDHVQVTAAVVLEIGRQLRDDQFKARVDGATMGSTQVATAAEKFVSDNSNSREFVREQLEKAASLLQQAAEYYAARDTCVQQAAAAAGITPVGEPAR